VGMFGVYRKYHIRLDADIVDWFKSRGKGY
jgi:uncharacterized protein (DUF4415 family)